MTVWGAREDGHTIYANFGYYYQKSPSIPTDIRSTPTISIPSPSHPLSAIKAQIKPPNPRQIIPLILKTHRARQCITRNSNQETHIPRTRRTIHRMRFPIKRQTTKQALRTAGLTTATSGIVPSVVAARGDVVVEKVVDAKEGTA
jgi:hypothetical protein